MRPIDQASPHHTKTLDPRNHCQQIPFSGTHRDRKTCEEMEVDYTQYLECENTESSYGITKSSSIYAIRHYNRGYRCKPAALDINW